MKNKKKIDPKKEKIIDKLQRCFKNELPREKLRKSSVQQLQISLTYALIGQLAGKNTQSIKL